MKVYGEDDIMLIVPDGSLRLKKSCNVTAGDWKDLLKELIILYNIFFYVFVFSRGIY